MVRRALVIGGVALSMLFWSTGSCLAGAGEREEEKGEEGAFCKALEGTIEGRLPLDQVHLGVTDGGGSGWRSLVLYGDGVGVWKGAKQFKVKPKAVKKMLRMLEKAHFCTLESEAGEADEPRVTRGITLVVGDLTKTVMQVEDKEGEREAGGHEAGKPEAGKPVVGKRGAEEREAEEREGAAHTLETLAPRLLDACEKQGEAGIVAASLQDGLDKVRDGVLAPEVLSVSINVPERGKGGGWIIQLHGRQAAVMSRDEKEGYGPKRLARLTEAEFAALATSLAGSGVAALPLNVYSPSYADLSVGVMNHRRSLQARAFAGMTPDTNRPAQQAFERLRAQLHDLYMKMSAPGAAASK
jgi:hypothetical protein